MKKKSNWRHKFLEVVLDIVLIGGGVLAVMILIYLIKYFAVRM